MQENVTVSHRGARYEIGRGQSFYGIWPTGATQSPPLEWWPDTPEGWQGAWSRFTAMEAPEGIVRVGQGPAPAGQDSAPTGQGPAPAGQHPALVARTGGRAVVAVALIAIGLACGIAGLFPDYLTGASLAKQPAELAPHLIYLAAWAASAVLILLGGARRRTGALLGTGTSIVTFGLFFADAGTAIAEGARLMGTGLVLSLIGWLGCAAGTVLAVQLRSADQPGRPPRHETGLTLTLAALAALGAAIAFAPSWDSYTLRTSAGVTQYLTAGNAFANPAPVIAGDVAVMVALVAVVVGAALWRPARYGAALLAGAIVPMVAQAISALVGVGEGTSPAQFGIPQSQAAQLGLTISSGLTLAFWVYCAFVVALALTCARMLTTPESVQVPEPSAAQAVGIEWVST